MTRPDRRGAEGERGGHVWVLNFDAEDELARGRGHTPNEATRARMAALVPLVHSLVGDNRVLPDGELVAARGLAGRAWCPTPSALRRLAAAGAVVPSAPPFAVLRGANHRRLSAGLGATLPGAGFFVDEAALLAHLGAGSPTAGGWVLKRPFAYAGRGHLRVSNFSGELASPTSPARRWIRASLASTSGGRAEADDGAGVDVSPWVDRVGDYALHGFLEGGRLHLGAPTQQRCDAGGRWVSSAAMHDLSMTEERALARETERAAEALVRIGYFGPFGVDAFRYRLEAHPAAPPRFCPRIEVNARYTMGWSTGFGS